MTAHTVEALFGRQSFNAVRLHTSRERSRRHAWAKPCPVARSYTLPRPLATSRERSRTNAWEKPCLAPRTCTLTHRSYVPRTITTARMGEALFGGETYNAVPLHTFRERSRTLAWAKPCLAGRPTALVRTQSPEQNTSRGRPSGMELPDYPVVAALPTPWDQDGPTPPLPARSFPGFVSRSASRPVFFRTRTSFCSRRVFSRIRTSLRFPSGLSQFRPTPVRRTVAGRARSSGRAGAGARRGCRARRYGRRRAPGLRRRRGSSTDDGR
jgi:hypothetical protein